MDDFVLVYSQYITVKGRRIYRADGKPFCLKIQRDKYRSDKDLDQ